MKSKFIVPILVLLIGLILQYFSRGFIRFPTVPEQKVEVSGILKEIGAFDGPACPDILYVITWGGFPFDNRMKNECGAPLQFEPVPIVANIVVWLSLAYYSYRRLDRS